MLDGWGGAMTSIKTLFMARFYYSRIQILLQGSISIDLYSKIFYFQTITHVVMLCDMFVYTTDTKG